MSNTIHQFARFDWSYVTHQRAGGICTTDFVYGGSVVSSAAIFGVRWSDLWGVFQRADENFDDIFWSRMATANQIPIYIPNRLDDVQREIAGPYRNPLSLQCPHIELKALLCVLYANVSIVSVQPLKNTSWQHEAMWRKTEPWQCTNFSESDMAWCLIYTVSSEPSAFVKEGHPGDAIDVSWHQLWTVRTGTSTPSHSCHWRFLCHTCPVQEKEDFYTAFSCLCNYTIDCGGELITMLLSKFSFFLFLDALTRAVDINVS